MRSRQASSLMSRNRPEKAVFCGSGLNGAGVRDTLCPQSGANHAFRRIRANCFRGLDRILAAHMILSAIARWSAIVPA